MSKRGRVSATTLLTNEWDVQICLKKELQAFARIQPQLWGNAAGDTWLEHLAVGTGAVWQEAEGPGMLPSGFPSESPGWPGKAAWKACKANWLRCKNQAIAFLSPNIFDSRTSTQNQAPWVNYWSSLLI